jgi:hypothetical protein
VHTVTARSAPSGESICVVEAMASLANEILAIDATQKMTLIDRTIRFKEIYSFI